MNGFWKLLSRASKYKTNIIWAVVFNILLSIFMVVSIPLIIPFFQILFDRVPADGGLSYTEKSDVLTGYFAHLIDSHGKEEALLIVCSLIIGTFFFKNLFRYLSMFHLAPLRTGLVYDLRNDLYHKYLHLPLSSLDSGRTGDFISRISADVQEVEHSIIKIIQVLFKAPLIIIGSIAYMIYLSPQLSVFVFILLLFTIFVIGGISRSLKSKSHIAQTRLSEISSHVDETIHGSRVIKAFGAENHMSGLFEKENQSYRSILTKIFRRQDLSSPLSEFLGVSIVAVLMYYGSNLVFDTKLMPEAFFAFIFAFYQVIEPSKSFSAAYYSIQKGLAAVDRIDNVLELKEENHTNSGRHLTFEQDINISNLTYGYVADHPVLTDLTMSINKGQTIAIVGPSGSGKSTLIDLLLGFYPVSRDMITIDGVDINDFGKSELRRLYSLVSQHAILFHGTIADNIVFGKESVSNDQIEAVAKAAHAHEFIHTLPEGYDTHIGEKGVKLSGGQKQRITIARALLHDSDILILDEATSALDSESELYVQQALDHIIENKTCLIIAHRLSTIQRADTILVLDQGKIVAQGTHTDLLERSHLYKKYVDMQTF